MMLDLQYSQLWKQLSKESVIITIGITIHIISIRTSQALNFVWVSTCKGAFIGTNTTICNAVTIGGNAIIGAGLS